MHHEAGSMFINATTPLRLCANQQAAGKYTFRLLFFPMVQGPADLVRDFRVPLKLYAPGRQEDQRVPHLLGVAEGKTIHFLNNECHT